MAHTPLLSALQRAVANIAADEIEALPESGDRRAATSRLAGPFTSSCR